MLTVSLISLPSETLQRLATEQQPAATAGEAGERRAGLAAIGLATLLGTLLAFLF